MLNETGRRERILNHFTHAPIEIIPSAINFITLGLGCHFDDLAVFSVPPRLKERPLDGTDRPTLKETALKDFSSRRHDGMDRRHEAFPGRARVLHGSLHLRK